MPPALPKKKKKRFKFHLAALGKEINIKVVIR